MTSRSDSDRPGARSGRHGGRGRRSGGGGRKNLNSEVLTGTTVCFQDIEGRELLHPESKGPFRRLLAHHCMVSHRHARAMDWTDHDMSEVEVQCTALMAHCLDEEAQRRLKVLWQK